MKRLQNYNFIWASWVHFYCRIFPCLIVRKVCLMKNNKPCMFQHISKRSYLVTHMLFSHRLDSWFLVFLHFCDQKCMLLLCAINKTSEVSTPQSQDLIKRKKWVVEDATFFPMPSVKFPLLFSLLELWT